MHEEERAHQFLMGFHDDLYSQVRGQILTQDPLPLLDKIFNIVLQEGNHKNLMIQGESRRKIVLQTKQKNSSQKTNLIGGRAHLVYKPLICCPYNLCGISSIPCN